MALRALQWRHRVLAGKRKTGSSVVESRVRPIDSVVARGALRYREARGDVVGYIAAQCLCAVPVLQMARRVAAVGRLNSQVVIVVGVATGAGRGDVRSG